jgi:hypothetical protein
MMIIQGIVFFPRATMTILMFVALNNTGSGGLVRFIPTPTRVRNQIEYVVSFVWVPVFAGTVVGRLCETDVLLRS